MITRESISIKITGDSFSPSEAERATGLSLSHAIEPGEIAPRGRYKGQPSPHGYANLSAPAETPEDGKLAALLDSFLPHVETFRQLGADDIVVYAGYFYEAQCNLTFWPDAMAKLGELGVPFWVSCYGDDAPSTVAVEPATAGRPRGLASGTLDRRRRKLRSVPPSASPLGG